METQTILSFSRMVEHGLPDGVQEHGDAEAAAAAVVAYAESRGFQVNRADTTSIAQTRHYEPPIHQGMAKVTGAMAEVGARVGRGQDTEERGPRG